MYHTADELRAIAKVIDALNEARDIDCAFGHVMVFYWCDTIQGRLACQDGDWTYEPLVEDDDEETQETDSEGTTEANQPGIAADVAAKEGEEKSQSRLRT
jgi:hypothetical protein